jgi:hypothetical protein
MKKEYTLRVKTIAKHSTCKASKASKDDAKWALKKHKIK